MKKLSFLLTVSALLMMVVTAEFHGQDQRPVAFTRAVIIDGNGGAPIENGTLVVRGEKIEAVGPAESVQVPASAEVRNLGGKVLMPGLADMHVHLVGGWDGVSGDMLGYQRYLNSLLYAGVTTVLDAGNVQPYVVQMRNEIAAGRLIGPRIYCAGAIVDGAEPEWPSISYSVTSIDQIPKIVRRLKEDRVDIIKAYIGLSDRMVMTLVQEARKNSLRVFIDQGHRNGSLDLTFTGIAAFAHVPDVPIFSLYSSDAINFMKQQGVMFTSSLAVIESFSRRRLSDLTFLDHPLIKDTTPPSFLADLRAGAQRELGPIPPGHDSPVERFKQRLKNVKALFDAGFLLNAGTDAPYPGVFLGEGIYHELELLVEAGLRPLEAITVATRNGALWIGAGKEWGTLESGKLANLLVINGRPDQRIQESRNIELVMQLGRILDRERLKLDVKTDPGFRPLSQVVMEKYSQRDTKAGEL
jgi:imidazolonepropionase-like amidohydrolase